jgi:hypothetical protein
MHLCKIGVSPNTETERQYVLTSLTLFTILKGGGGGYKELVYVMEDQCIPIVPFRISL